VTNIDYPKFISNRYDLVLRYYFLESTGFDIDSAVDMFEQEEYDLIREIILDTKQNLPLFKRRDHWDFVFDSLIKDHEWTKKHPYIITPEYVGVSVKRFLYSIHLNQSLYWTVSNRYYKPIVGKTVWERDTYIASPLLKQSKILKMLINSELKMLEDMNRLKFFRPETYIQSEGMKLT